MLQVSPPALRSVGIFEVFFICFQSLLLTIKGKPVAYTVFWLLVRIRSQIPYHLVAGGMDSAFGIYFLLKSKQKRTRVSNTVLFMLNYQQMLKFPW